MNTKTPLFDDYLTAFDYDERRAMKIDSEELAEMLKDGADVQFIDIRFKEEFAAWHVFPAKNIPLNELPQRLDELDRDKLVVTACPHCDRAIMARTFLATQGFHARYLVDGLLGLAEYLRGDRARDFVNALEKVDGKR